MFHWKLFLFIVFLGYSNSYSQENNSNTFDFKWDNGFKLERKDGLFSLKFGGYIFIDHASFHQNTELSKNFGALESKSGTEIRAARLYFSGNVYRNTNFKFQIDFAGDKVLLKDVYISISDIPGIGNFRIGHFKEPFRFSTLTSSKYLTLMEPAANSYFAQGRNNGAMVFNDFLDTHLSVQIGAFRNANNQGNDILADDGYVLDGRVTGVPFRNNEKKQLLHVGASYSYRKPSSQEYNISISPGSHIAEKYTSTMPMEFVENVNLLNLETVFIHRSFSLQAEYLAASVSTINDSFKFSNYYTELSYFITGESKNYQGSYEGLGRIKPKKNFGGSEKGSGAWELAFRYSKTDLNDGLILGGKESQIALGINWYLNPVTRLMVNYVKNNLEDKGSLDIVQARFQIDF